MMHAYQDFPQECFKCNLLSKTLPLSNTAARCMLLADPTDIADAAFRAGYESQSQFSREKSRMFGCPPRVDLNQMWEIYSPGQMQYGCRKAAPELILNGRHWQNEHVNIYCKLGVIKRGNEICQFIHISYNCYS